MIPLLEEDSEEEMEAMKNQFNVLHKRSIDRQTSNQFLLRTPNEDTPQTDGNDQKYNYDNIQNDKKHFPDYGSDENVKVDEEDVAAMKEAFDKQQKLLLKTQIEKSFRLRIPETIKDDEDDNGDKDDGDDDEFNNSISLSDIDQETEEKLVEDSEEMKTQFQELNKMMIRYRSTKTLEMGMNPQIKPKHKEQFNMLMKDIGIVNEHIMDELWKNVEKTVHDDDDDEEEEDDIEDKHIIEKLQKENDSLRQQIKEEKDVTDTNNVPQKEDEKPGIGLFFNLKLTGCCT